MPNSAGSEPAAAPETPPPAETTIEHEREFGPDPAKRRIEGPTGSNRTAAMEVSAAMLGDMLARAGFEGYEISRIYTSVGSTPRPAPVQTAT